MPKQPYGIAECARCKENRPVAKDGICFRCRGHEKAEHDGDTAVPRQRYDVHVVAEIDSVEARAFGITAEEVLDMTDPHGRVFRVMFRIISMRPAPVVVRRAAGSRASSKPRKLNTLFDM